MRRPFHGRREGSRNGKGDSQCQLAPSPHRRQRLKVRWPSITFGARHGQSKSSKSNQSVSKNARRDTSLMDASLGTEFERGLGLVPLWKLGKQKRRPERASQSKGKIKQILAWGSLEPGSSCKHSSIHPSRHATQSIHVHAPNSTKSIRRSLSGDCDSYTEIWPTTALGYIKPSLPIANPHRIRQLVQYSPFILFYVHV